jgi:hypothetical protein
LADSCYIEGAGHRYPVPWPKALEIAYQVVIVEEDHPLTFNTLYRYEGACHDDVNVFVLDGTTTI